MPRVKKEGLRYAHLIAQGAGCRRTLCGGRCGSLLKLLQFVRGNDKFRKTAVQTDYDLLANIDGRKVCPLYIREAR